MSRSPSNGCRRCGFLLGQHFDMDGVWDKRRIAAFAVPLDETWRRALIEPGDERKWSRARRRRAGSGKG